MAIGAIAARLGGGFLTGLTKNGFGQLLGTTLVGETMKHAIVNPILGATGLYYRPTPAAAPPIPAAAMQSFVSGPAGMGQPGFGGLSAQQFEQIYGERGAGPFGMMLPWQDSQGVYGREMSAYRQQQKDLARMGWGYMDQASRRQAGVQRDMFGMQERVASTRSAAQERMNDRMYGAQERMAAGGFDVQRYLGGVQRDIGFENARTQRHLGDTQVRIADLQSGRALAGLEDTNRTNVRLADRQLWGLYDTNRRDVKMADIGARRDMHLADRGVEAARWGGSMPRIAQFGQMMRR